MQRMLPEIRYNEKEVKKTPPPEKNLGKRINFEMTIEGWSEEKKKAIQRLFDRVDGTDPSAGIYYDGKTYTVVLSKDFWVRAREIKQQLKNKNLPKDDLAALRVESRKFKTLINNTSKQLGKFLTDPTLIPIRKRHKKANDKSRLTKVGWNRHLRPDAVHDVSPVIRRKVYHVVRGQEEHEDSLVKAKAILRSPRRTQLERKNVIDKRRSRKEGVKGNHVKVEKRKGGMGKSLSKNIVIEHKDGTARRLSKSGQLTPELIQLSDKTISQIRRITASDVSQYIDSAQDHDEGESFSRRRRKGKDAVKPPKVVDTIARQVIQSAKLASEAWLGYEYDDESGMVKIIASEESLRRIAVNGYLSEFYRTLTDRIREYVDKLEIEKSQPQKGGKKKVLPELREMLFETVRSVIEWDYQIGSQYSRLESADSNGIANHILEKVNTRLHDKRDTYIDRLPYLPGNSKRRVNIYDEGKLYEKNDIDQFASPDNRNIQILLKDMLTRVEGAKTELNMREAASAMTVIGDIEHQINARLRKEAAWLHPERATGITQSNTEDENNSRPIQNHPRLISKQRKGNNENQP